MGHRLQNARHGDLSRRTGLSALGNPIDFFVADHMHEREICAILDQITQGTLKRPELIETALAFFREELPHHLADEEQVLFPLMVERCDPEDQIEETLDRLRSEHAHAREDNQRVTTILENCLKDRALVADPKSCNFLSSYTNHARRHLIVENAILLPIARVRLTKVDLDTLLLKMLKRRGLDRLLELPDTE